MPYPALNCAFDALFLKGSSTTGRPTSSGSSPTRRSTRTSSTARRTPPSHSTMHLYPINGAVAGSARTRPPSRTVTCEFAVVIAGMWPDPADTMANTAWVRDYYAAIHRYSGTEGGYVNFMGADDAARAPANYGGNYERLAKIKATYDPDNLFHLNQNIPPATGA